MTERQFREQESPDRALSGVLSTSSGNAAATPWPHPTAHPSDIALFIGLVRMTGIALE